MKDANSMKVLQLVIRSSRSIWLDNNEGICFEIHDKMSWYSLVAKQWEGDVCEELVFSNPWRSDLDDFSKIIVIFFFRWRRAVIRPETVLCHVSFIVLFRLRVSKALQHQLWLHITLSLTLFTSQEELVDILLSTFQVEACYLQEQAILSMYSYSAVSGIIGEFQDSIKSPERLCLLKSCLL